MKNQATVGTSNTRNRRRQALSQADVRVIFACISNNGPAPDGTDFKIIAVPKLGGKNELKLSPPPYQYEDGVYVLLRLNVAIPSMLSDRVLLHRDLSLKLECPWGLSGPQYSGASIDLQQRYCTPKGKDDEYCKYIKGSIWTMMDSNGKESFDCRVFHVYRSSKQATNNNDGSPKQAGVSPKKNRRRRSSPASKKSSLKVLMPDPETSKSNAKDDESFKDRVGAEEASSSPRNVSSACWATSSDGDVLDAKPKRRRQEQSPTPSAESDEKVDPSTGKARQTTRSWSTAEDRELARFVGREPDIARIAWNFLARQMENRSGKQCRERYVNHLRPDRKKGKWTEPEDRHIIRLQAMLGNQWSKIAAALPGRSDNDVKNRWHSRMRSQKRKYAKISCQKPSEGETEEKSNSATTKSRRRKRQSKASSLVKDDSSQQGSDIGSNVDFAAKETPKVGQRAQVKFDGGKLYGGTITKVSLQVNSTQKLRYNIMIHYDDGSSEESLFPDEDIYLFTMNNELSENEVMLCHELLNLHNALTKPDEAGGTKNQVSEEESHESSEHISTDSREGNGSFPGSGYETGANGTATAGSGRKPPAEGHGDKESTKPSPKVSKSEVSKNGGATTSISSPQAVDARGLMPNAPCPFRAPAVHHARAPFFALPNQQQQQLLAAAQLLSSVNPALAVAAISQAHIGITHRGRLSPGAFFPRPPRNNGFPINFALPDFRPPLGELSVPRRETNTSGMATRELPSLHSLSSKAGNHIGL